MLVLGTTYSYGKNVAIYRSDNVFNLLDIYQSRQQATLIICSQIAGTQAMAEDVFGNGFSRTNGTEPQA